MSYAELIIYNLILLADKKYISRGNIISKFNLPSQFASAMREQPRITDFLNMIFVKNENFVNYFLRQ